jgi:hypothetical protein
MRRISQRVARIHTDMKEGEMRPTRPRRSQRRFENDRVGITAARRNKNGPDHEDFLKTIAARAFDLHQSSSGNPADLHVPDLSDRKELDRSQTGELGP